MTLKRLCFIFLYIKARKERRKEGKGAGIRGMKANTSLAAYSLIRPLFSVGGDGKSALPLRSSNGRHGI